MKITEETYVSEILNEYGDIADVMETNVIQIRFWLHPFIEQQEVVLPLLYWQKSLLNEKTLISCNYSLKAHLP